MQNGVDHHPHSHGSSDNDVIMSDKQDLTKTMSAITMTPEQFEKVCLDFLPLAAGRRDLHADLE